MPVGILPPAIGAPCAPTSAILQGQDRFGWARDALLSFYPVDGLLARDLLSSWVQGACTVQALQLRKRVSIWTESAPQQARYPLPCGFKGDVITHSVDEESSLWNTLTLLRRIIWHRLRSRRRSGCLGEDPDPSAGVASFPRKRGS